MALRYGAIDSDLYREIAGQLCSNGQASPLAMSLNGRARR